jgi:hypothetical protein
MNNNSNADDIQKAINQDLFPTSAPQVDNIKQVLAFMEDVAQPISEDQVRAIILLTELGSNERLHDKKNPYDLIIKNISTLYKKAVAPTEVYLETIERLVPKPPKPIVMAEKMDKGGK